MGTDRKPPAGSDACGGPVISPRRGSLGPQTCPRTLGEATTRVSKAYGTACAKRTTAKCFLLSRESRGSGWRGPRLVPQSAIIHLRGNTPHCAVAGSRVSSTPAAVPLTTVMGTAVARLPPPGPALPSAPATACAQGELGCSAIGDAPQEPGASAAGSLRLCTVLGACARAACRSGHPQYGAG